MHQTYEKYGVIIVSVLVTLGFVAFMVAAIGHELKDNQTVQLLTGGLISSFTTVVQYWLGSSSGSKSKDETIQALQDK
jgi:hypothetical protein